uniref:SCAN box domain-containing protein n=1 Tax=Xenopus tropicalis TaxID=8364 RepID=A0A803JI35_XENTR
MVLKQIESDQKHKVEEQRWRQDELNVETFRQRFRAYRYSNFDGPREPERKTGEQILEMIALEQFIEILPDKVKLWVQEHRPETSTKAISLAEDFLLARREAEQRITSDYRTGSQVALSIDYWERLS